jgi:hypothetical protein
LIYPRSGPKPPAKNLRRKATARYFFHVVGADSAFRDEGGRGFPSQGDAEARAVVIAGELSRKGENYQGFVVCVTDQEGRELARVPIAEDAN